MIDFEAVRHAYRSPPPPNDHVPTIEERIAAYEHQRVRQAQELGLDPRVEGLGEHGSLIGGPGKPPTRFEGGQFAGNGGSLGVCDGCQDAAQCFRILLLGHQQVVEVAVSEYAEVEYSALELSCQNLRSAFRWDVGSVCPLSVGVADGGPRNRHENGGAFREMDTQPASFDFHGLRPLGPRVLQVGRSLRLAGLRFAPDSGRDP